MTPSPLRSDDPQQLGSYRLLARLGEGGMGSVFLGENQFGVHVAVKTVRPELSADPAFIARFRGEVKRAKQVPPFCTAEVLDASTDDDPPYLVVEYVNGPSLADVVHERGPLARGDLHGVAIGMATALAAIHDAGVVHRDLKPANVLFAPLGAPKVIDFGIAKGIDTSHHLTQPGQILGTIAYMSPERFNAEEAARVGTAADIFAWGVVVSYAATGHTPFAPETLIATAGGIPLPQPDLSEVPLPLRDLVAQALAPEPNERPNAHELLEQLLRAGAEGNTTIRASLDRHPDLRRAAAAVRHTAPLQPATGSAVPARSSIASLAKSMHTYTQRLPAKTVGVVATAALIAGFAAYPTAHRLVPHRDDSQASTADQADLADRGDTADDKASRANRQGRCTLDGPLEVTTRAPKPYTCPAALNPGQQAIHARIKISTPGACAAVWTHVNDDDAYRITACTDHVALDREHQGQIQPIAFAAIYPPADATAWHQLDISTPNQGVVIALDHDQVISKTRLASQPRQGAVSLGLVTTAESPSKPAVIFADVSVTTGP